MSRDPVAGHGLSRCVVLFTPRRVEVVRGGLDLAGAGIDSAEGRPDAPGTPAGAGGRLGRAAGGGDVGVRDAEALQLQPVVRNEVVEGMNARERGGHRLQVAPKPGMDTHRDRVQRLPGRDRAAVTPWEADRKSTRLNSSHRTNSYAVFCLKIKKKE